MAKTKLYVSSLCTLANSAQKIDGVAVNNEHYSGIHDAVVSVRTDHLTKLDEIRTEAAKQADGTLLTHFSVGWWWSKVSGNLDYFTWNGNNRTAGEHMIDIFNSVDVQVGRVSEIPSCTLW